MNLPPPGGGGRKGATESVTRYTVSASWGGGGELSLTYTTHRRTSDLALGGGVAVLELGGGGGEAHLPHHQLHTLTCSIFR